MRAFLVGTRAQRQRVRERLDGPLRAIEIVAEFASLAAARSSGVAAEVVLLAAASQEDEDDPVVETLTAREIDVLELVSEGLSNKQIADRLEISDQTVKFHLASIAGKLGAANRTDAVGRAVRLGLITL
jgi:DNA-binding NarL/FixJ family response regulator